MNRDVILPMVALVAMIVLVGANVWRRGMSRQSALKLAALWICIIGGLWLVVTLVNRFDLPAHFT